MSGAGRPRRSLGTVARRPEGDRFLAESKTGRRLVGASRPNITTTSITEEASITDGYIPCTTVLRRIPMPGISTS